MSICSVCALMLFSDTGLCPHHTIVDPNGWAESNRAACDFFHRGIVRPELGYHEDPYMPIELFS